MKLFERLTKSKLDEMQEQKLAKIERNISRIAIFGLLALFLIELLLFGYDWKIVGGEFILLMILCFYEIIASLRAGIWSRTIEPNEKTNLACSLAAGAIVFVFFLAMTLLKWSGPPIAGLITAAFGAVATFVLTYFLLAVSLHDYRRRQAEEERQSDAEETMENRKEQK